MRLITVLIFLATALISKSQVTFRGGEYKIMLNSGFNSLTVPTRTNKFIDGNQDFKSIHSTTIGADINVEFWPVVFKNIGYGYYLEISKGWLFSTSHTFQKKGHLVYVGTKKIRFLYEYSNFSRETFGHTVEYIDRTNVNETINWSKYEDITRNTYGAWIIFNSSFEIKFSYVVDFYSYVPSSSWDRTSHGLYLRLGKNNSFSIYTEYIWDHPVWGILLADVSKSTLDALPKQNFYLEFGIIKKISIIKDKYSNIFK